MAQMSFLLGGRIDQVGHALLTVPMTSLSALIEQSREKVVPVPDASKLL